MPRPGMVNIASTSSYTGNARRRVLGLGTDNNVYLYNSSTNVWDLCYPSLTSPSTGDFANRGNVPIVWITASATQTALVAGTELVDIYGLGKEDNLIYRWDETTGLWNLL